MNQLQTILTLSYPFIEEYNVGAYYIRGCAYEKQGNNEKGIEDFSFVLELDCQHVNAVFARAACFNKLGDFNRAIEDYNKALELDQQKQQLMNSVIKRISSLLSQKLSQSQIFSKQCSNQKQSTSNSSFKLNSNTNQGNQINYGQAYDNESCQSSTKMSKFSQSICYNLNSSKAYKILNQNEEDFIYPNEPNINFIHMNSSQVIQNRQSCQKQKQCQASSYKPSQNQDEIKNSSQIPFIHSKTLSYHGRFSTQKQQQTTSQLNQLITKINIQNKEICINNQITLIRRQNSSNSLHSTVISSTHLEEQPSFQSDMSFFANFNQESSSFVRYKGEAKKIAETLHSKGFEMRKTGDFNKAIQLYSQAIELNPNNFKAYFNRGFAYNKLEKYDLAITDYTKALEIDPNNAYAFYNRGISLDHQNMFDDAINNFTMAISLDNKKADFFHNRAFAYKKKEKNYEMAINDYAKAIQIDSKHFKAYYNRAFCFSKINNYQYAEKEYTQALMIQPQNINVLYNYGCLLEKMNTSESLEDALTCFNEAIYFDISYTSSYNARGFVFDKLKNCEQSYSDFYKAINLDKNNPVFIHNREYCLRNVGKKILFNFFHQIL